MLYHRAANHDVRSPIPLDDTNDATCGLLARSSPLSRLRLKDSSFGEDLVAFTFVFRVFCVIVLESSYSWFRRSLIRH